MGVPNQRQYTIEYKQKAVALAQETGVTRAAKKLGIPTGNLYTWKKSFVPAVTTVVTPTTTPRTTGNETVDIQVLSRQNAELRKMNQILKATIAILAQDFTH